MLRNDTLHPFKKVIDALEGDIISSVPFFDFTNLVFNEMTTPLRTASNHRITPNSNADDNMHINASRYKNLEISLSASKKHNSPSMKNKISSSISGSNNNDNNIDNNNSSDSSNSSSDVSDDEHNSVTNMIIR